MNPKAVRLRRAIIGLFIGVLSIYGEQVGVYRDEDFLEKMLRVMPATSAMKVERMFSFPKETDAHDDHYFWDPYDLAADLQRNLYIADRSNTIFKYDSNGKFLAGIGRTGQGPGDLSMPFDITIVDNILAVKESANHRVQYFDLLGRPLRSTKIFKTYCSFDVDKYGWIYGVPLLFRPDKNQSIIEVISADGRLEKAFGQLLDFPNDFQQFNMAYVFLNGSKELITVFMYLPIMRRYTLDGRLIGEYPIQSEMLDLKNQYNRSLYLKRPGNRVAYINVVRGAAICQERLFLTDFVPPRLWIYEVDLSGKIMSTYYATVGQHYTPVAIVPLFGDTKASFYVLTKTPEPRVDFFVSEK